MVNMAIGFLLLALVFLLVSLVYLFKAAYYNQELKKSLDRLERLLSRKD